MEIFIIMAKKREREREREREKRGNKYQNSIDTSYTT
jgi:hypothetical protein